MISVIIPLYNKEPIIERSLQSVISQDYDDFEVVVVNDGSTDRSADIVRSINDPRIRLIEQENGGPSKARNTGTKNARGEWIVFLDADDELLPGALTNFHTKTIEHPNHDMFFGRMSTCSGEDEKRTERLIKDNFKAYCCDKLYIGPGSTIYRTSLLMDNLFDERIRRNEDIELLFRLFRCAKIYLINDIVCYRNLEYSSASKARNDIKEDYIGYVSLEGSKSIWEKIAKYWFFMSEWPYYPQQAKVIQKNLFKRIDMKILCLLFHKLKNCFCSIEKYINIR